MNLTWNTIAERGQYETGFVDAFQTILKGKKAVAIITFLPQFEDKDQKVLFTLLLEGKRHEWTQGTINDILEDVENRIKNMENLRFRIFNSLEYMTIQIFNLNNIEDFECLNIGDYTFIEK